jgi:hypothetical protein
MAGESAEGPWSPAPRPCPRRPSTPWCRRATSLARAAKASNVCSSNMGALLLRQRMHPDGPSYNELAATLQSPAPHSSPGSRLLTKRTCPRRPRQSCHGLCCCILPDLTSWSLYQQRNVCRAAPE